MENYLELQVPDCRNCYKCIRHCPVKSITFSDKKANIIPEECILCGTCYIKCPQHAKLIRNDIPRVQELVRESGVFVSLAPSYIARFPNVTISAMEKALIALGFLGVRETAEGATVITHAYEEIVASDKQSIVISTCCHSVNLLIQKGFPHLMKFMAKVLSPMQASAAMIKEEFPGSKVVFIGPCIAKKEEADQYKEIVDAVLTFDELELWMKERNIEFETVEDEREKGRARLFPIPGGILRSMEKQENYSYMAIDGASKCIKALNDIEKGKLQNFFLEMSICEGSCTGGPVMGDWRYTPVSNQIVVDQFAGSKHWKIQTKVSEHLHKTMHLLEVHLPTPTDAEIQEILLAMGKRKPEDELNCGSCGYNNCRTKALAVYRKKADLTMCLPYLKEKAESFSDVVVGNTPNGIVVLNEQMQVQMMNPTARKWFGIHEESDLTDMPMDRIGRVESYVDTMLSGKKYSGVQNFEKFGKVLEENVTYDENLHLILIIYRDITAQVRVKEVREQLTTETLRVTDQVIENQMRIVQEIASLLGETTAQTQVALSKLQDRLRDE